MSGTDLQVIEFDNAKLDLIKRTVAKGATQDEFELFLHACKRTGLDPLMKQIHAIKRWNAAEQRETMAIQTGIDGYRLVAERTGKYAGSDDPVFEEKNALATSPVKATVTVWKMVDGVRCPFTASARFDEYAQKKKDGSITSFWQRMPYGQLAKCAEALALRKAFPAELSGVYTHEEMQQADSEPMKPILSIPQVRPKQDATMVQPATDKYTGEPKQEEDGATESTDTLETQKRSDAPPAHSKIMMNSAEYCRQQAEQAPASAKELPLPRFTFGKHKGKPVDDPSIPDDYLSWIEPKIVEWVNDYKRVAHKPENQALLDAVRGVLIDRNAMPLA